MKINANTKIAAIIKEHPDALDAIVGISSKFEKLRNPILRKLMAARASIAMAAKIGGCSIHTFFEKLQPLGFEIDALTMPATEVIREVPAFITLLKKDQLVELDVRPVITSGKDPLGIITEKVKTIQVGEVLKIINIFEPVPLMKLLQKQGFEVYADVISDNLVETYFFKKDISAGNVLGRQTDATKGWDEVLQRFGDQLQMIDVRQLEMPLPMHTILEAIGKLPDDMALYVYHKRIPVYLIPELAEREFDYRIKEISDGEVHLLIFKSYNVYC
jgi:uncharacterized protein (DUF2249 family)